jgi:hypothetical protein
VGQLRESGEYRMGRIESGTQVRMLLLLPAMSMRAVSRRFRPMRARFLTGTRRRRSSEGAHSLLW